MTQSITSGQFKQLKRFIEDAVSDIAEPAIFQANLDKDDAQRVITRGNKLGVAIEKAITGVLKELGLPHPVPLETKFLRPVAQAIIPARTESFDVKEFFDGANRNPFCYFAFDPDLRAMMGVVGPTPERSYVAFSLKEDTRDRYILEPSDENLSTLEDIAGLILEHRSLVQPVFVSDVHAENIFYVKGKSGRIFTVTIKQQSHGWSVISHNFDQMGIWFAGDRVFRPGKMAV